MTPPRPIDCLRHPLVAVTQGHVSYLMAYDCGDFVFVSVGKSDQASVDAHLAPGKGVGPLSKTTNSHSVPGRSTGQHLIRLPIRLTMALCEALFDSLSLFHLRKLAFRLFCQVFVGEHRRSHPSNGKSKRKTGIEIFISLKQKASMQKRKPIHDRRRNWQEGKDAPSA